MAKQGIASTPYLPKISSTVKALAGLLFLLALPAISTLADAAEANRYCAGLQNFSKAIIFSQSPELQCRDLDWIDDLYGEVMRLSPHRASRPTLLLEARWKLDNGDYDPNRDTVGLGFTPGRKNEKRAAQVVLVHEVGHKIFQEHIDRRIAIYAEFSRVRERVAAFSEEVMAPFYGLLEENPGCRKDPACHPRFQTLQSKAATREDPEKLMQAFAERNREALAIANPLTSVYQELYADVVTAVYWNDPDVEQSALTGVDPTDRTCRSFSHPLSASFRTDEPHCALSLLREPLWRRWIQPRLLTKHQLLNDLAKAFVDDLAEQLARKQAGEQVSNDAIIHSLRTRLHL